MPPLPQRKNLPHEVPAWVPDDSRYFITINGRTRGRDELCRDGRGEALLRSIPAYEAAHKWFVHVLVVMPDHLHVIVTFNRSPGLLSVIRAWKGYQARMLGIEWQPGFFEHRLRNDAEFMEKASYIRMNPVRKGLVSEWRDWPHLWQRGLW